MKRNLLFILILAMSLPLLGNPVDENTAKQLAQSFWKENNIIGVKGDKIFKKKMDDARFVNVAPQCGYTEFYIFNNEDGKGFVIIAADDCVTPILGYSYDNNFAAENLPPNLKGWLDGYAEQIQAAVEMKLTATEEIRTEWECLQQSKNLPIKSETAVSPLITTFWDQSYPYNKYCPYNSLTGEYTATGCVATAMAQIMRYWNFPVHGYGSHSYNDWFYGQISANFGNTNYQWSSMPSRLYSNSSQTQINAVAILMFHCGVSVEMNYGIDGSDASIIYNGYNGYNNYCAENAFKNYFGYSSSLHGRKKNDHSESEWIYQLKTELDNYRPILYGGQGSGGHAFVCDGYNYYNYFHFNWGWSGQGQGTNNDTYYYINNLNPLSHNFSNSQVAIMGIQPKSYQISATSSPTEGGSVSGQGTYYQDRSCTLHASANTGYTFIKWTENGSYISSNPYYTFTVTNNKNLVANFQRNNYTITVKANPADGGTAAGGNTFSYGQPCTVKATAKTGYVFVNWTENGTQVSTNANYSFTVYGNRNLIANFRKNYTISVTANPTIGGSVTGGGTYYQNQTCTVQATAKTGYKFVNWTENGTQVSTNANYIITVTSNRTLVANFVQDVPSHTILTTVGSNGRISPSGAIIVTHGADQTFSIIPDQDYEIKEIYVDGSAVGATSSYTFTNVTKDHRIYATFKSIIGIEEDTVTESNTYPNPTTGIVNIKCNEATQVNVFNAFGQLLLTQSTNGNDQQTIDISNLPDGLYLIQMIEESGIATKQIIKIQ